MIPIPLEPIIREGVTLWQWLEVLTSGVSLFGALFFLWSHEKHIRQLNDRIDELEESNDSRGVPADD